jgi:biopolymer transport protein ExbD
VLLVIFILTTTPLANDIELNLPAAAKHQKDPPRKANYITVQEDGKIFLNKTPAEIASLQEMLVAMRIGDPDLNVIVRGDARTKYRQIRAVLDICQQANVAKVDLATEAADKKPDKK